MPMEILKLLKIDYGFSTLEVQRKYKEEYGYVVESTIRKKLNFLESSSWVRHEDQGRTRIWYLTSEGKKKLKEAGY